MRNIKTKYPFVVYADSRQGGRPENQDTCSWEDTPYGLLVTVCDGMGGGPSGKLASTLAAEYMTHYIMEQKDLLDRCTLLREAIEYANQAIRERERLDKATMGMGTTAAVLLINSDSAVVAHVGDSRVYQFRKGKKHFRTNDHSLVFEKLRDGFYKNEEEAGLSGESNIILRALGIKDEVQVDVQELPYEKGDRFLLCSDGIWGAFPEKEIVRMGAGTKVLSGAMESLIVRVDEEGVNNGNRHDNLTAVILETRNDSIYKEQMSTKQKNLFLALAAVCALSLMLNLYFLIANGKKHGPKVDPVESKQVEESTVLPAPPAEPPVVQVTDQNSQLIEELDKLIEDVESLRLEEGGASKEAHVKKVRKSFRKFSSEAKDIVDARQLREIGEWLGNSLCYRGDDKAIGHYNAIIQHLNEIKQEL